MDRWHKTRRQCGHDTIRSVKWALSIQHCLDIDNLLRAIQNRDVNPGRNVRATWNELHNTVAVLVKRDSHSEVAAGPSAAAGGNWRSSPLESAYGKARISLASGARPRNPAQAGTSNWIRRRFVAVSPPSASIGPNTPWTTRSGSDFGSLCRLGVWVVPVMCRAANRAVGSLSFSIEVSSRRFKPSLLYGGLGCGPSRSRGSSLNSFQALHRFPENPQLPNAVSFPGKYKPSPEHYREE